MYPHSRDLICPRAVGWVERSDTHHLATQHKGDGYRCAPPILRSKTLLRLRVKPHQALVVEQLDVRAVHDDRKAVLGGIGRVVQRAAVAAMVVDAPGAGPALLALGADEHGGG